MQHGRGVERDRLTFEQLLWRRGAAASAPGLGTRCLTRLRGLWDWRALIPRIFHHQGKTTPALSPPARTHKYVMHPCRHRDQPYRMSRPEKRPSLPFKHSGAKLEKGKIGSL